MSDLLQNHVGGREFDFLEIDIIFKNFSLNF